MTSIRLTLALVAGLLSTASAVSAETTYDCSFTSYTRDGLVPERLILALDTQTGAAAAFDGVIKAVHNAPIPVNSTQRSASSWRLDWNLDNIPGHLNRSLTATYKVNLNTARNTATIAVIVHGYDNETRGTGTCKIIK
ncbi:hypothetical protein [Thalassococcus sp. S3]|uniref:hypothetical protein n=1 Tax=Thalassococcus sp. S3 TaxID=2017482 RepID=UPI0010243767|nr:hypothetical protein [Thalassococcus sp. S3]QBF33268.1 hypothetical protein CFI11_18860 [Thalassococcus sp. S3]